MLLYFFFTFYYHLLSHKLKTIHMNHNLFFTSKFSNQKEILMADKFK